MFFGVKTGDGETGKHNCEDMVGPSPVAFDQRLFLISSLVGFLFVDDWFDKVTLTVSR